VSGAKIERPTVKDREESEAGQAAGEAREAAGAAQGWNVGGG
jgi:hypothetical protein